MRGRARWILLAVVPLLSGSVAFAETPHGRQVGANGSPTLAKLSELGSDAIPKRPLRRLRDAIRETRRSHEPDARGSIFVFDGLEAVNAILGLDGSGGQSEQRTVGIPRCFGEDATIVATPGVPVVGTPGHDVIVGTSGADQIEAGEDDDAVCGLGGNDTILGGGGDDLVQGDGELESTLRGRDGIDGGPGDDVLLGGPANDVIVGGADFDIVAGFQGDDLLDGHGVAGEDAAVDELLYTFAHRSVRVDLRAETANGEGTDTVLNFEAVAGSCFDDVIGGSSESNFLNGGWGTDRLSGRGGLDVLEGDNDLSRGIPWCVEDEGDDILDGGVGDDWVTFFGADGVQASLKDGTSQGSGNDRLLSISSIGGSPGDDVLLGDAGMNYIEPSEGNDVVHGFGGIDTIGYWDVDDYHDPEVPYVPEESGVRLDLERGQARIILQEPGGRVLRERDGLEGIEFAIGSTFDDVLRGDGTPNFLAGDEGNDRLVGRGSPDVLNGGIGEDAIFGGASGRDLADYFLTTPADVSPLCADLGDGLGSALCGIEPGTAVIDMSEPPGGNFVFTDPEDDVDTLVGVEAVEGTSWFDIIVGDDVSNQLYGVTGDDLLVGGLGNDFMEGNDQFAILDWFTFFGLDGGVPGDALVGGEGSDQCASAEVIAECEGTSRGLNHPILTIANDIWDDPRIRKGGG